MTANRATYAILAHHHHPRILIRRIRASRHPPADYLSVFPPREERAFIKALFAPQTTSREALRFIFAKRANSLSLSLLPRCFAIRRLRSGEANVSVQLPFRKIMDIVRQPVAAPSFSRKICGFGPRRISAPLFLPALPRRVLSLLMVFAN